MSGASLGWAVLLWSVAWLTPAQAVPIEVAMQTSIGEIHIALDADRAPITVGNFLRYVDAKRFDGITIYRAVKIDEEGKYGLVQGGLRGDPKRAYKPILHESPSATGLSHTAGAISMARLAPGTATADFFFVIGDLVALDGTPDGADPGYAVFGRVTQGLELLQQVLLLPRSAEAGDGSMQGQILAEPVKVTTVRRVPVSPPAPT